MKIIKIINNISSNENINEDKDLNSLGNAIDNNINSINKGKNKYSDKLNLNS